MSVNRIVVACALVTALNGCGLFTPEKGLLSNDDVDPPNASPQGMFEQNVVAHIRCEIRNGVAKALQLPNVKWLASDEAIVTLKLTVEDQSGLTPSASFISTFGKAAAEMFTFGIAGNGSAHATRIETIQFNYSNAELLSEARKDIRAGLLSCQGYQNGVMIDSNLKIGQFIYDKAIVAGAAGEATSKGVTTAPFSQLQFDLTFTASFSGSVSPTWKFTRTTVGSGTLFSATRTDTDEVIITLGPPTSGTQALHSAALIGSSAGQAGRTLSSGM